MREEAGRENRMEWGQEAGEGTQAGKEKQVQRRREEGPPAGVGSGPNVLPGTCHAPTPPEWL